MAHLFLFEPTTARPKSRLSITTEAQIVGGDMFANGMRPVHPAEILREKSCVPEYVWQYPGGGAASDHATG
jgi:hypothetical protein